MKKEFSKEYMLNNCGCYAKNDFIMSVPFMQATNITLELILKSEIPIKDKYWFVCRKLATPAQNIVIAIGMAETVLPIYEKEYPTDMRIRECIDAAKKFINKEKNIDYLREKRKADAAYVAYAAAYAAYAVAYAAYQERLLNFLLKFCGV